MKQIIDLVEKSYFEKYGHEEDPVEEYVGACPRCKKIIEDKYSVWDSFLCPHCDARVQVIHRRPIKLEVIDDGEPDE